MSIRSELVAVGERVREMGGISRSGAGAGSGDEEECRRGVGG